MRDDSLIANVAHELRNPLTCLKIRLDLARMQPEKTLEHLAMMEVLTDTMADLIDNLLDATRLELGKLQLNRRLIVLQDLISRVIELQNPQARYKGVVLISELPANPLEGFVDPLRLHQVLTNLIANAINYTPEGGEITVRLACQDDQIVIRVCDMGIGIPAHLLDDIFEPFFRVGQSASKGTGLGLTISREIVKAHDGIITVESSVGQGSVFSIWLPQHLDIN